MAYQKAFLSLTAVFISLTLSSSDLYEKPLESSPETLREASAKNESPQAKLKKSPKEETVYGKKLQKMGVKLRPGTEHRKDSRPTQATSKRCRSLVYQTLEKLPNDHQKQLQELTLFYTKDGRRGLGGSGSIVLRCLNVTDAELVSVFVHEMGHLVDASFLTGSDSNGVENFSGFYDFEDPVPSDDASSYFYSIAWTNESNRKTETSEYDFVSLYAMSDPFEDFSETYTYYRLHGDEFRKLTQASLLLKKKYDFMKEFVFQGQEFGDFSDRENLDIWERDYDVTVLPFPLKGFLS